MMFLTLYMNWKADFQPCWQSPQPTTVVLFWSLLCYNFSHLHFLNLLISVQQFLIRKSSRSQLASQEDADTTLSIRRELTYAGPVGISLLQDRSPAHEEIQLTQQTLEHRKKLKFSFFLEHIVNVLILFFKYQNLNDSLDYCYHAVLLLSEWPFTLLVTVKITNVYRALIR